MWLSQWTFVFIQIKISIIKNQNQISFSSKEIKYSFDKVDMLELDGWLWKNKIRSKKEINNWRANDLKQCQ